MVAVGWPLPTDVPELSVWMSIVAAAILIGLVVWGIVLAFMYGRRPERPKAAEERVEPRKAA